MKVFLGKQGKRASIILKGELRKQENFLKLMGFPAFTKWEEDGFEVRINNSNIAYLYKQFPDVEWDWNCSHIRDEYFSHIQEVENMKEVQASAMGQEVNYEYKRPPMDHQHEAFMVSRDAKSFGLFMDQGTGKTKVTCDTASYLYLKGHIDMMIIVAWPNGVHRNWVENEMQEDMTVPYKVDFWAKNHKTKKKRASIMEVVEKPFKGLKCLAFNVEAFTSKDAKAIMLQALKSNRCLMVIDQSASIKNQSALRTKFLVEECSELAPYKRILDGAPVAEGAEELYSQIRFLNPDIIGHDTYTGFKSEYCKVSMREQDRFRVIGYRNIERLMDKIEPFVFRARSSECLDLPPKVYNKWSFELSNEEARVFNELRSKNIAFFREEDIEKDDYSECETITEELALTKSLRLQQISSGWFPVKGEPDKIINKKEIPSRLSALLKLLEQNEGKAIIFSRFRADLDLLQETLGSEAVSFHGGIHENDREPNKKKFMTDPHCKYFLGQPRTAGIGHTLTAAQHIIFYSNDSALRFRVECEARAWRKGLEHEKLMIWDLHGLGTQDAKITKALRSKRKISDAILKDPDTFFLDYV